MAQDAFGNWISGVTVTAAGEFPGSVSNMESGVGPPASDLGDIGDGYVDISNGDFYTKKNAGWELQSGVGGGGSPQVMSYAGAPDPGSLPPPDNAGGEAICYSIDNSGPIFTWNIDTQAWN